MGKNQQITLDDIANLSGVSVATVSQALSGKGRMATSTRERIMQIVEDLSYHPDIAAQNLARRRASQLESDHKPKKRREGLGTTMALLDLLDSSEIKILFQMEIQQLSEEGFEVSKFSEILNGDQKYSKRKYSGLYQNLLKAPAKTEFIFQEPETLGEIKAARPEGLREMNLVITPAALYDKIHGGWLGRSIGCVLGKPIESGWPKSKVIQYLKLADSYPLLNYIPRVLPHPPDFELNPESDGFFLGEIAGVPYDDDIDYTILALHNIESNGIHFSSDDVATEWLGHLPYFRTYTAERTAYKNLSMNISPPDSARFLNPAREFIGARIRTDLYGYVTPGKPELSSEMAYKDAAISHTKNGIYSAMMTSAMISWSFVTNDPYEIIRAGLSQIPAFCRLSQAVKDVMDLRERTPDWEIAYDRLILSYGKYHPVHSINNTLWIVLAMLYGDGDFDKTLGIAVTCGLDTDCNGANVGSIMGILSGAQGIPQKWVEPLQDTIYTSVSQWKEKRISEIARRTAIIAEKTLSGYS